MGELVYYHLPNDEQYSLRFVHPDESRVRARSAEYDEARTETRTYDLDTEVFALYTASESLGAAEELDYDFQDEIQRMGRDDQTITVRFLGLFRSILDETFEEENERLKAYKQVEVDEIPDALAHVDWDGTVPDVGGDLVSSLVLKHTLPNANHRTSLALLELYIQAHEYGFGLPEMATREFQWQTWVNNYIRDSKRLLTVRRNNRKFFYLWGFGCNEVQRKDGIRIHLENYSLDMPPHEAYEHYAERHRELCTQLVTEILRREGYEELIEEFGMQKAQFAERLREMP